MHFKDVPDKEQVKYTLKMELNDIAGRLNP
jgi:hypothetical protein